MLLKSVVCTATKLSNLKSRLNGLSFLGDGLFYACCEVRKYCSRHTLLYNRIIWPARYDGCKQL